MTTRRLLLLVCAAAALCAAPPPSAAPKLLVGAAEESPKDVNPIRAKTKMDLLKLAGLNSVRMTALWRREETEPSEFELLLLQNAATAAELNGMTLYLSVFWMSRNTPLTEEHREQFAQFVTSLARSLPTVKHFIIGNENNLNLFWMPQFDAVGRNVAAIGYEAVLERAYDALKEVSPTIEVIGGALSPRGEDKHTSRRHTHSPTKFILDLGRAYRASGRATPIMDAFAFHPYLTRSKFVPTKKHPRSTTIAIADYGKLVGLLGRAFNGTPQRGSTLPIIYDEFGVQSRIPSRKMPAYSNAGAPAAADAVTERVQAAYYRKALELAYCQPNVKAMLLFLMKDESDLARWQSGVYYADGTPKSSLKAVKRAAVAARAGKLTRCSRGLPVTSASTKAGARKPAAARKKASLARRKSPHRTARARAEAAKKRPHDSKRPDASKRRDASRPRTDASDKPRRP